jgi:Holliday junction resolvasome RuvABC ATP-dependent DNA helicase subunit
MENSMPHSFGSSLHEWEWIQQSPCISQQVCKRCCEIGQTKEEHQWKEIYKPNSYEIQKICERCGVTTTYLSGFSNFIGQEEIKLNLLTLVAAARKKGEPLHHLLLCGQSGMGKATLAKIIAAEMGSDLKIISGKTIVLAGDLAAILTNLRNHILIIEQIEAIRKPILEILVPAMEDFILDIIIGKGPSARPLKLKLPHFTVVGITKNPLQVDERLSSLMFAFNLAAYNKTDIAKIVSLLATQKGISIEKEASDLITERINGRPGEVLQFLKKLHEYAIAYSDGYITSSVAEKALDMFGTNVSSTNFERMPIPDDVKMFVWQRDQGRCVKCGSQENLEYDHIIPVSKGGSNTVRNIQLLCEKCNRQKSFNIA